MNLQKQAGKGPVSFQGAFGAYSDQAARKFFPDADTLPCATFEDAASAVRGGAARFAVIPVDNTLAGRVADVHRLLPQWGLFVVGETILPIRHCLLGTGAIDQVTEVHSHIHALPQCDAYIKTHGLTPKVHADTAGAAEMISQLKDPAKAAIASELAGTIYGLNVLARDIQDEDHNATRFLVLAPEPFAPGDEPCLTTLLFRVRNIPAALHKALGAFAAHGVQLSKLESYMDPNFQAAQFLCDVEGVADKGGLALALNELKAFTEDVKILGSYPKA